jgi:hypothetical protein
MGLGDEAPWGVTRTHAINLAQVNARLSPWRCFIFYVYIHDYSMYLDAQSYKLSKHTVSSLKYLLKETYRRRHHLG